MKRWKGAAVAAAVVALVASPTAASADGGHRGHDGGGRPDDQVTPVAEGLNGPRQLDDYGEHSLVVAEADTGEVSSVSLDDGDVELLNTFTYPEGIYPEGPAAAQGVDYADGKLYVTLGEVDDPMNRAPVQDVPETTPPPRCEETAAMPAAPALVVAEPHGDIRFVCDLLRYELIVNPDGQTQFPEKQTDSPQVPLDSLSNPYDVLVQERRVLVVDAGANTVLSIDRHTGEIEPFFVPEVITTGPCADPPEERENNHPDFRDSCDPTPTSIDEGPDGHLYVSGLSGLAPGEGRIYVLDPRGHLVKTIADGLNPLTGIEVDGNGTIYVSEFTGDVPFGEPPDDAAAPAPPAAQPPPPGRIVRIDCDGARSYAAVGFPQGLELQDGRLYAAAFSFPPTPPDTPPTGRVVDVGLGAFGPPAPAPDPAPAP
jgi:hypothetical protein